MHIAGSFVLMVAVCGSARGATSITALPALPSGGTSAATSVSWDGTVVAGSLGTTVAGVPVARAARWTNAGAAQNLGAPPTAESSYGLAISGDGAVVGGQYVDPAGDFYYNFGLRWTSQSGMQSLRQTGQFVRQSSINALSRNGSAAAATNGSTTLAKQACRWTTAGGYQSLGSLQANGYSEGLGISADGATLVGFAYESVNGGSAFKWTETTGMQRLTSLGPGLYAKANAVSADGQVSVGLSSAGPGLQRAVRWDGEGNILNLGVLPGMDGSVALGVNINGSMIVGNATLGLNGTKPFLWTADTGMVDLAALLISKGVNLTGWTLTSATAISADGGTIVGYGMFNGVGRGWVVSNVPAPGAFVVFGALGLAGIGRRRRS